MDPEIDRLARKILSVFADAPGSGKSTLAYPLTAHLNAVLSGRPEKTFAVDSSTGLIPSMKAGPSSLPESPISAGGGGDEVAICVGLDGWHHSRKELDKFEDPDHAHFRRGAAFTFNLPSYLSFVQRLRIPLSPLPPPRAIPFPTFNHALKDPTPSPISILPPHRIVIIEGLYTMLDRPGWRECAEMMDLRVWVETDRQVCRERVIRRNFEAGIVDDLKACEERVDASDMVNGDEVRQNRYLPTDIIEPKDDLSLGNGNAST